MWWVYPKCSSITKKNCKKLGLGQFFVTVYFLYHYIYIHTHRGNPSEKKRERHPGWTVCVFPMITRSGFDGYQERERNREIEF